jgi:hypothetical protein
VVKLGETGGAEEGDEVGGGVFAEVEAVGNGGEILRDVVRAGVAAGGDAEVGAAGAEDAGDFAELGEGVVGVKMLHKLVAVDEISGGVGQGEVESVGEEEAEIGRGAWGGGDGGGDLDGGDAADEGRGGEGEGAVSGSDFDEVNGGAKEGAEGAKLAEGLAADFLWAGGAGELGVVGDAAEKLLVNLAIEAGALGGGGAEEAAGKLAFDFVMGAEAVGGAHEREKYPGGRPLSE